jgi:hypothetical protein
MKAYLEQLANQFREAEAILATPAGEAGLKKITGRLLPGAVCAWCFEEDTTFWRKERIKYPYPKEWPYQGFIIPNPNTDGRREMETENVCLIVTDYPIEKENPKVDWSPLALLLAAPGLHRFYVFSTIIAH